MPTARAAKAAAVNPGLFRSIRRECRVSETTSFSVMAQWVRRCTVPDRLARPLVFRPRGFHTRITFRAVRCRAPFRRLPSLLKAVDPAPGRGARVRGTAMAGHTLRGLHILLVDDNQDTLDAIR